MLLRPERIVLHPIWFKRPHAHRSGWEPGYCVLSLYLFAFCSRRLHRKSSLAKAHMNTTPNLLALLFSTSPTRLSSKQIIYELAIQKGWSLRLPRNSRNFLESVSLMRATKFGITTNQPQGLNGLHTSSRQRGRGPFIIHFIINNGIIHRFKMVRQ